MVHARPIPGYNGTSSDEPEVNGHEEINLEARRRHRQEKQPAVDDDTEKILTIEQAQVDQPEEDQTEEQEADADHNDEQPQDQKPQTKGQKISKDHLRTILLGICDKLRGCCHLPKKGFFLSNVFYDT